MEFCLLMGTKLKQNTIRFFFSSQSVCFLSHASHVWLNSKRETVQCDEKHVQNLFAHKHFSASAYCFQNNKGKNPYIPVNTFHRAFVESTI